MISARLVDSSSADVEALRIEALAELRGERGGDGLRGAGDDPDLTVLGSIGDAAVGYAAGRLQGTVLALDELFVSEPMRGVGVGTLVLGAALSWAEEHDVERIESTALPGMRATKNFFETHGMVAQRIVVGRRVGR